MMNISKIVPSTFVGTSNLPNQAHHYSIRTGFRFNLLVVGESELGKATLINSIFNVQFYPEKPPRQLGSDLRQTMSIQKLTAELEERGVQLTLNIVTAPGYGDFINNDKSWVPILENIESRYEDYMDQEQKMPKSQIVDNRIHACIYFIPPTGHSLRHLDMETMYYVGNRVNLIPVIAKSDILSASELATAKELILADIEARKIQIYIPPTFPDDDSETVSEMNAIKEKIPFAVSGSNVEQTDPEGRVRRVRKYPWGVFDICDPKQCDFNVLRQLLIKTNMEEMRNYTHVVLYEAYRTQKMKTQGRENDLQVADAFNVDLENERDNHKMRLQKMEHDMTVVFESKVQEKEAKLRNSEAELHARHREMREALERQRAELEEKKRKLEGILLQMGSSGSNSDRGRKKGYFK